MASQPTVTVMSGPWARVAVAIRPAADCDELATENLQDVFGFPSDTSRATTRFNVQTSEPLGRVQPLPQDWHEAREELRPTLMTKNT
jgi:hypothetical protein